MSNQDVRTSTIAKPHFNYGYIIVIASFFVIMVNVGMASSFGIFFKPMLNDFGWARAVISAPIAASGIINGLLSIIMGGLSDKIGPRKVVMLCGLLTGTGYLLMSQINEVWQLYLFMGVLIGAGMSVLVPLMSTVARWFVHRRTIMTGIIVSGGGVGGFILPLIANWLISSYGWRHSYIILGAVFLIIVFVAAQFLKRDPSQTEQPAPVITESRMQAPDISVKSFSLKESARTRHFWLMITSFFCFGFSLGVVQTHIVPHAIDVNISATNAASILSTVNGVSIIGNIVLGAIGDKIGNKRLFIIAFILQAAALFWLIYIQELGMFYIFAVLSGLAYGSGLAQQSPLVARVFGIRSHGLILGVLTPGQMFGVGLGSFLAGYIFDINGSYRLIFMICGILCIVGVLLTMLIKPLKDNPKSMVLKSDS